MMYRALILATLSILFFLATFSYGVHVGKMETEKKFLEKGVENERKAREENELAQKEHPVGEKDFSGIWGRVCEKP